VRGNSFDATRKVTLRGLLSMTGGRRRCQAFSATRPERRCPPSRKFSRVARRQIRRRSR
jgi:hypothetical protein